ncbi:MAG: nucleoside phosphorylase [Promethearchaeota archaeon]
MKPRARDHAKAKVASKMFGRMSQDERIVRGVLGVRATDVPDRLLVVATENFSKGATSRLKNVKVKGRLATGKYSDTTIGVLDTGIGSPAAIIFLEATAKTNPQVFIRADFCGGLSSDHDIGHAFIADSVLVGDGAGSAYFGAGKKIAADSTLTKDVYAISTNSGLPTHRGTMWTTDVLLRQTEELLQEWVGKGAHAVDMETSAILGIASENKIPAASINCISDLQLHRKPLFGPEIDPMLLRGIDLVIDAAIQALVEWK